MSSRKRKEREGEEHTAAVIQDQPSEAIIPKASSDKKQIIKIVAKDLWKDDPDIVLEALKTLHELVSYPPATHYQQAKHNHREVMYSGGHLAIVKVMNRFEDNADICKAAGSLLRVLSVCSSNQQSRIIDVGGVEAMIKSLKHEELVAECVLNIAKVLRGQKEGIDRFLSAGGITIVADKIMAHPSDEEILRNASYLFQLVCLGGRKVKNAIMDAHGLVLLASALEEPFSRNVRYEIREAMLTLIEELD